MRRNQIHPSSTFTLIILMCAILGISGCASTPLIDAAYSGDINTAKNILDSGANIDEIGGGAGALCAAASSGKVDMVRFLLNRGADPNGAGGHSPIRNAVKGGHISIVRALLDAGAEISGSDLRSSKQSGNTFIVQMLEEELKKRFQTDNKTTLVAHKKQIMVNAPQGIKQPLPSETKMPMSKHELSRSWAVIIGISQYQYSGQKGLTNLIFADDDAKSFARSLHNLGWSDSHIKLLINEDATQRNITIALESWLTKAGPNDQIVLFWAGHGFPDPEDPEKVYFACYDTDISIPATGYRMDRVRMSLEERKSKNVVLLADTCHAGKLITRGDGSRGISIVPNIKKMVREKNIPKGWVFMVGADTDRQSIEHSAWSNGAFTHSLLKGIGGEADGYQSMGPKDNIVTMGELRAYMNTAMPDETQKVLGVAKRPVITTSTGDPDIWNLTLQVTQ